jgi:hypothetical protein
MDPYAKPKERSIGAAPAEDPARVAICGTADAART